jgi:hypothetical protein
MRTQAAFVIVPPTKVEHRARDLPRGRRVGNQTTCYGRAIARHADLTRKGKDGHHSLLLLKW